LISLIQITLFDSQRAIVRLFLDAEPKMSQVCSFSQKWPLKRCSENLSLRKRTWNSFKGRQSITHLFHFNHSAGKLKIDLQNALEKEIILWDVSGHKKVPSSTKFSIDNRKMRTKNQSEPIISFNRQVSRHDSVAFRRSAIRKVPSEALKSALFARY